MVYHNHHIIPKHMGGTDNASNIVRLTIEEHAEAHKTLYDKHGKWEDKLAWQALSGQITHAEATRQANVLQATGNKNRLGMKDTPETRAKMSKSAKIRAKRMKKWVGEDNPGYGKGKSFTVDGIDYNSLKEFQQLTGKSRYYARKYQRGEL